MGDYLTNADLLLRFDSDDQVAYLTGDEASGVPSSAKLAEAVDAGEGGVNIRLAQRYETPVSTTDATATASVKRLATDLSEYYLRARKKSGLSEDSHKMRDDAVAELDGLADGTLSLPGAAVLTSTQSKTDAYWSDSSRDLSDDSGRAMTRRKAVGL